MPHSMFSDIRILKELLFDGPEAWATGMDLRDRERTKCPAEGLQPEPAQGSAATLYSAYLPCSKTITQHLRPRLILVQTHKQCWL